MKWWWARLADSGTAILEILTQYIMITHALYSGLLAYFVGLCGSAESSSLALTYRSRCNFSTASSTDCRLWTGFGVVQATLLSQIGLTSRESKEYLLILASRIVSP